MTNEEYRDFIRQEWKTLTKNFHSVLNRYYQLSCSRFNTQHFEDEDWMRLESMQERAKQFLVSCQKLREQAPSRETMFSEIQEGKTPQENNTKRIYWHCPYGKKPLVPAVILRYNPKTVHIAFEGVISSNQWQIRNVKPEQTSSRTNDASIDRLIYKSQSLEIAQAKEELAILDAFVRPVGRRKNSKP